MRPDSASLESILHTPASVLPRRLQLVGPFLMLLVLLALIGGLFVRPLLAVAGVLAAALLAWAMLLHHRPKRQFIEKAVAAGHDAATARTLYETYDWDAHDEDEAVAQHR
ncbi:MAG TPA: hypothetical protein VF699_12055 [Caulobacteraceae bacterium]